MIWIYMQSIAVLAGLVAWNYCEYKYRRDDAFVHEMRRQAAEFLLTTKAKDSMFYHYHLTRYMNEYKMVDATYDSVDIIGNYIIDVWRKMKIIALFPGGFKVVHMTSEWEKYITVEGYTTWLKGKYGHI